MIPKIIHFCWLSADPYPEKIQKCIDSWKEFLPDYEFIHWDLEKLKELNSNWAIQAFENKKYAFAADFVRCYSVFHYGGIYLDTDVEVLKSFNDLLGYKSFIGLDSNGDLEAAIFGAEQHTEWVKKALDFYKNRNFINQDGSFNIVTMPKVLRSALNDTIPTELNINKPTCYNNIELFPKEYFSPKDYTTGKVAPNFNSYTIHHFEASWLPRNNWRWKKHKLKLMASKVFGFNFIRKISDLYYRNLR